MNQEKWDTIRNQFWKLPDGCRYAPASEAEIEAFEAEFGAIPADFRRFLSELGGGTIGSKWVDGIADLPATHRKFQEESAIANGWTMKNVFLIGWDGSGNPFGIEVRTGRILVEDHDFGGVHEMSSSFQSFLLDGLK